MNRKFGQFFILYYSRNAPKLLVITSAGRKEAVIHVNVPKVSRDKASKANFLENKALNHLAKKPYGKPHCPFLKCLADQQLSGFSLFSTSCFPLGQPNTFLNINTLLDSSKCTLAGQMAPRIVA
jgi:hypothetical protein